MMIDMMKVRMEQDIAYNESLEIDKAKVSCSALCCALNRVFLCGTFFAATTSNLL